MMQYIIPASGLLFTLENILWINIGVFIGSVFAAIPGLSIILCVILFLPVTYTMSAIPGMMFLLGIYCAGGYGGSVSAILINTPGTPPCSSYHAGWTSSFPERQNEGGIKDRLVCVYVWRCVLCTDAVVFRSSGCKSCRNAGNSGILYGLRIWSYHYRGSIRKEYYPRTDFRMSGTVYCLYRFRSDDQLRPVYFWN